LPVPPWAALLTAATLLIPIPSNAELPIQKANLTLAIDDALLQRASEAALRENTTVYALVREFLGR
jgi:hypothetical protein